MVITMDDILQKAETNRHQKLIRQKRMEKRFEKEEKKNVYHDGICKCGNAYSYMGIDLGYCIKCLDEMEKKKK